MIRIGKGRKKIAVMGFVRRFIQLIPSKEKTLTAINKSLSGYYIDELLTLVFIAKPLNQFF